MVDALRISSSVIGSSRIGSFDFAINGHHSEESQSFGMNNTLVYLAVDLTALNFEEKLCHIANDVLSSCSLSSLLKCSRICDSDAFYSRGKGLRI